MIKELKLPEIAENVDTATVLKLLVSAGDKIEEEQNVAEMESDKATFDLPSEIAGTVKEIKISEGDDVKVGDVVMTIDTEA
ncbi:MAG: biotin/lipoyl-containing protein [Bacteroidota bacterium]|nr:biotin/lipoyl-containing protein [Bacteroidota bacterium]